MVPDELERSEPTYGRFNCAKVNASDNAVNSKRLLQKLLHGLWQRTGLGKLSNGTVLDSSTTVLFHAGRFGISGMSFVDRGC